MANWSLMLPGNKPLGGSGESPHSQGWSIDAPTPQLEATPRHCYFPARLTCGKHKAGSGIQKKCPVRGMQRLMSASGSMYTGNGQGCADVGGPSRAPATQTLTHFIFQKCYEVGNITFPFSPRE